MDNWIENVNALRVQGDFKQTMAVLLDLLKANPVDPLIHYHIAWTHDALGREIDAVSFYKKAIKLGLKGDDLQGAYLGLGSTYRSLGEYENSKKVFKKAISLFPQNSAMKVFYSLTLYNLDCHAKAMEVLLKELIETTSDKSIKRYSRALLYYSDKLDQKFE